MDDGAKAYVRSRRTARVVSGLCAYYGGGVHGRDLIRPISAVPVAVRVAGITTVAGDDGDNTPRRGRVSSDPREISRIRALVRLAVYT
ncbi:hypothetical protein MRX96_057696 [Rhipicephalus microplus]